MSFRERMQVKVSRAEEEIFKELQRRHLCDGLETQHGIKLDVEQDGVEGTIIDFFWSPWYAAFIDGVKITKKGFLKLHLRPRQERRDKLIKAALERRGITVDRFQYTPPLPVRKRNEICDKIQVRLGVHERPEVMGFIEKFTLRPKLECCIAFEEEAVEGPKGGWRRLGYYVVRTCFKTDYPGAFEDWKDKFPCVRDGKCVWSGWRANG